MLSTLHALTAAAAVLVVHGSFLPSLPLPKTRPATGAPQPNSTDTLSYFDQLIDHNNPSLGTFKQRYFFSDQFWAGPGSPIILYNPGEQSADGSSGTFGNNDLYLTRGLVEIYRAAGVVLEHRYYGQSSPYQNLTTQNLQYLTVEQVLADTIYFIQNVALPWTAGNDAGCTTPDKTPWLHFGCSYPGLLAAFTQEKYPGIFAAAWATSAPVQANGDFWQYWEPIEEGLPKNCTSDLAASVSYIDNVMATGTADQVRAMKAKFGLAVLENDDFADMLTIPWVLWQGMDPGDYHDNGQNLIYNICDAIETKSDGTLNMEATGVGLPFALDNWAAATSVFLGDSSCNGQGEMCDMTSYNYSSPMYTDWSVRSYEYGGAGRQWDWLMCHELGWFAPGDPGNSSSIVSAFASQEHSMRVCDHEFPNEDGSLGSFNSNAAALSTNTKFKGWNLKADNLFVVNGQYDPWRSVSLSSDFGPSHVNIPTQDIVVIPGAHHCWDFFLESTIFNSDVLHVQNQGIETLYQWLEDWYTAHPNVQKHLPPLPDVNAKYGYLNSTITSVGLAEMASSAPQVVASPNSSLRIRRADTENASDETSNVTAWWSNKTTAIAFFVLSIVLVVALVIAVVGGIIASSRRKAEAKKTTSAVVFTQWQECDTSSLEKWDALGGYGAGRGSSTGEENRTLMATHYRDD